ncbi:39S ribosomal protein L13, mitochondrial [Microplitis demolitor]|uniref:39S ribosomal protein L13, mitochondrial n=1 Tax=Microplitis demolitor TaxID=69319 RepID=UPI0004CD4965|nr:39S ribosomal protein L13, mitochondrial [Microplitis demolitor]
MSLIRRAQQWGSLSRIWYLYDAKWQDPYQSAVHLVPYLLGKTKPIYAPMSLCGDHVVVINSKDIALRGDEWKKRVYFHHTTYHSGDTWTLAWELHRKNKTMIVKKAVYHAMRNNLQRRHTMERLHIYPDDNVPKEIMENISNQIPQLRPVPTKLYDISEQVVDKFPRLMAYPSNYILK